VKFINLSFIYNLEKSCYSAYFVAATAACKQTPCYSSELRVRDEGKFAGMEPIKGSYMHLSGTQNASVSSFLPVCASLTHACLRGLFLSLHLQLDWAVNTCPHLPTDVQTLSWIPVSHLWLDFTENTEIVTGTFSESTDADLENYSCNFSISYFFVSQF